MNTKFQLLIIVIVSLIVLSSSVRIASYPGNEKNTTITSESKSEKDAAKRVEFAHAVESKNASIPMIPISHQIPGFDGPNTNDDGITHHFHFERVRKSRRYAVLFCVLAKIIVFLTHAALLICTYCHAVNH